MAPTKFEDQIRDKLEKRQLQPSHDAWDRLERELENEGQPPNNRRIWWLGIAASVVGILLLVTFSTKDENQIEQPAVVETPSEQVSPIPQPDQEAENKIAVENELMEDVVAQQPSPKTQIKEEEFANDETLVLAESNLEKENPLQEDEAIAELSFEDQKALEVAAQIRAMQETNDSLKEVEIDALLADAQREIELKKLYDEATNKVDAEALLESVEYDLEKSFREKVFEALKDSYKTVKTAVAERNN